MSVINYEDIYTYLSYSRNLNQFIKRCDIARLLTLKNKIDAHIKAWEIQQKKAHDERQQREEKRRELLSLILSEGFTPDEFITETAPKTGRRKMKYQYNDGGKIKKWSGVGRVPRPIREQLKSGLSLEHFLIKEEIKPDSQNKNPHN